MKQFISLEGLDGAGKSTQIKLLTRYYQEQGHSVKFIHFPRSGQGVYGQLVASFLRGDYGALEQVHPQLVALLFAGDRHDFAPTMRQWLAEGHVVLVDRYVLSNITFQCAKLQDEKQAAALSDWIEMLEYEYHSIPKPDISLFLDVPDAFTRRALSSKRTGQDRDYLKGKDDIHEADHTFQLKVKAQYERLLEGGHGLHRITCYDDKEQMLSPEEVHRLVLDKIENK